MQEEKKHLLSFERIYYRSLSSNIVYLAGVEQEYHSGRLQSAADRLAGVHPVLKWGTACEGENVYYVDRGYRLRIREQDPGNEKSWIYTESRYSFDLEKECLLRISVVPEAGRFKMAFSAHHLLGDAKSVLFILADLIRLYNGEQPDSIEEPYLISERCEIPEEARLSVNQDYYIKSLNQRWEREKQLFDWPAYQSLRERSRKENTYDFQYAAFGKEETEALINRCREHHITITALFGGVLLLALARLNDRCYKLLISVDIRSELGIPKRCAGNFCSNVEVNGIKDDNDVWKLSEALFRKMKQKLDSRADKYLSFQIMEKLDGTLVDSIPFSCLGESRSGVLRMTADMMNMSRKHKNYEISNVGKHYLDPSVESVVYVPPFEPSNLLTLGAISVNETLHISIVYDSVYLEQTFIAGILDEFKKLETR